MVQWVHELVRKRDSNIWTWSRCCICEFMMASTNHDMLHFAKEQDLEIVTEAAQHGGWADFADEDGNTALHHAIMACQDLEETLAEAKELGIKIEDPEEPTASPHVSQMTEQKILKNREARRVLQGRVDAFFGRLETDWRVVDALLDYAYADPNLTNDTGQSAFDMCKKKSPIIIGLLNDQVKRLEAIANDEDDCRRKYVNDKPKPNLRDFHESWRYQVGVNTNAHSSGKVPASRLPDGSQPAGVTTFPPGPRKAKKLPPKGGKKK